MSNSCHTPQMSSEQSCSFFISPMSTLSANLGTNLHIRRNLTFNSDADNNLVKLAETDQNVAAVLTSPNRMLKHAKLSPGVGGSPNNGGRVRQIFAKRTSGNLVCGLKTPTDKENSSSRQSFGGMMEYALESDDECSPSKFTVSRSVSRERYPLEDQDPNSQDSGFSLSSYSCFEDSKSSSNFRFAEPNGVPPRRTMTVEFSPGRESSPSNRKSISPRYRKELLHRISTDSMSSDFSDDGFAENVMLPSAGSVLMEQDENARLPPGFSALLSEPIFNLSKVKESSRISSSSSSSSETNVLQTSFRRSLTENIVTTNRTVVRSSVETDFSDFLLEKDSLKRAAEDDEARPFLKRRKSYSKVITSDVTWSSGPATAPPAPPSRVTLFDYGFSIKTNVKFQRSFSETEATIKRAVQRAASNSNLIGDFSRPCILPLVMGDPDTADLKNIDCHTLAKLMNGDYNDDVCSYTIIDCRYPFEYEGGHIRGAVNIYSRPQMMKALNERRLSNKSSENSVDADARKRNILIFHCEYSSKRGPSLSRYLRNEDRQKNGIHYPKLDYPEIYLLKEGYKTFFGHYGSLCEPQGYITMNDPNHSESLRKLKTYSKSTGCIGESRKLRTSSYKRLGL